MKAVQINATCGMGSTGKICIGISRAMTQSEIENYILYSSGQSDFPCSVKCSGRYYIKFEALKSHICGNYGFNSTLSTKKMLAEINRIQPDIVHLHNIHGHDCNLELLFKYIKDRHIKLFWTFHDCWAFTAYCPHFTLVGCERWKSGCRDCPQHRQYSWFFDKSKQLYEQKKELFSGLDLTVVTPSEWLAGLVKQSFLKDYPIKVINNGIDLSVFCPTKSDFRSKYNIPSDKYIVLGVSFEFNNKKGLDVFVRLSQRLDMQKYQVVLVGTDSQTDKLLPKNIISVHRTKNQAELAEIYTAATVFANPSREETFPTVNIEALACGTPIVTFRTGGSPEILTDSCGSVVDYDDYDAFEKEIVRVCEKKPYTSADCVDRAAGYNSNDKFAEYTKLYKGE